MSNDFDTEKSESINQFSLVTGSHNSLKRDFDDFRDSAALKSDALASEISFQIDDLNTEFNKKLNVFNQELESAIDTFNTDNKSIIGKFDVKFENLHETVSSIASQIHKDNQELKSDLDKRGNFLENNSIKQIFKEEDLNFLVKDYTFFLDNIQERDFVTDEPLQSLYTAYNHRLKENK